VEPGCCASPPRRHGPTLSQQAQRCLQLHVMPPPRPLMYALAGAACACYGCASMQRRERAY
jgi:hypothetical protein